MAIVALMAPAVAVCAGASAQMASGRHDCCPKEEMTADTAATPSSSMSESCCRMSDDAGQRVPVSAASVTAPTPSTTAAPVWQLAANTRLTTLHGLDDAPTSDHVPRHILLSVLLI